MKLAVEASRYVFQSIMSIYCWLICFLLGQQAVTNLFYVKWIGYTPRSVTQRAFETKTCTQKKNPPLEKKDKQVEQHLQESVHRNAISDPKFWNPTVSVRIVVLCFLLETASTSVTMILITIQFSGESTSQTYLRKNTHTLRQDGPFVISSFRVVK